MKARGAVADAQTVELVRVDVLSMDDLMLDSLGFGIPGHGTGVNMYTVSCHMKSAGRLSISEDLIYGD